VFTMTRYNLGDLWRRPGISVNFSSEDERLQPKVAPPGTRLPKSACSKATRASPAQSGRRKMLFSTSGSGLIAHLRSRTAGTTLQGGGTPHGLDFINAVTKE
jgi:hypothetical protein